MNNEEKILSTLDVVVEKVSNLETSVNGLETRFDGLETRFDGLETRFDGLETRFDGLETRFDGLETRFGGLETNQDFFAAELSKMTATQDKLIATVTDLDAYARNELATKQELYEVETRLTGHIDGLSQSFKGHDVEICALNARMSRAEGHIFGS